MKRLLLLMLVAVALSACNKDPLEDAMKSDSVITLQLNMSESSIVQTRAQSANETTLNNLWLFTFNSSGTLVGKWKAVNIQNATHTADVMLPFGTGLNIYACANVSAADEIKFNALATGTAKVADLKAIKSTLSPLTAPGLPMWGELLNQTITAATTKVNMTLTRSCSRVDIVASGIADFTLSGIEKLLKTASVAPIFPAGSLVAASSTTDVVPTNKTLNSIYLYENAIDATTEDARRNKATEIIIKGTYKGFTGFYKLRLKYSTSPEVYNIGRNVIYSINITEVKAPGFATLAEAEANLPQNVDYTATASDGDATDLTTSNGQYYLGVTNSEYIAYNSDAMINVPVVTVTHNAPSTITAGTITASGTGLTLRTPIIPTNIQKQVINVDMTSGFTSGTLTLRLGNLMKVVTIKKKPTINMNGEYVADFSALSYVQGDLDQTPTWFKFAKNNITVEATQKVQNPSGGIWMYFLQNIGETNRARTSGAYVSSTDAKGRARVVVKQEAAVLEYKSGVPTENVTRTNPTPFVVNVRTDLPGWSIEAYTSGNSIELKLGVKTGNPVRGIPANCSIPVTVADNPGANRYIHLNLIAAEDPNVKIWFGAFWQEGMPPIISINPVSQSNISYFGGKYTTTVTSTHAWSVTNTLSGLTVSPSSGVAGTTSVSITVPANVSAPSRDIKIYFKATNGSHTSEALWTGSQLGYSPPAGSYIPRSVLAAAGWPANRLPAVGLQVATRGIKVLPGGTPAVSDELSKWKLSETFTTGVERIAAIENAVLGVGKNNTATMAGSEHPAAQSCKDLGPEWYLPSIKELMLIFSNNDLLGSAFKLAPQGYYGYWSSSESNQGSQAWTIEPDGSPIINFKSTVQSGVRCVREI